MVERHALSDPPTTTPQPDPTVLTTAQLQREAANLKEIVLTRQEIITARLDSMDKAIVVFSDNLTRVPTATDRATQTLKDLIFERIATIDERIELNKQVRDQKFDAIATQFRERDTRVDQTARASKEALDAALQAAKEAVGKQNDSFVTSIAKSEAATAKQIDQLVLLQNAAATATNDKIDDLKDRLTSIEGVDRGKTTQVATAHASTFNVTNIFGIVFGAIGMLIGFVGIVLAIRH